MHNTVDALVFFNLSLINALALISEYSKSQYYVENLSFRKGLSVYSSINFISDSLQIILIYAPIVVLFMIATAKVVHRVKELWYTYKRNDTHVDVNDVLDYSRNINEDSTLQWQQSSDYGSIGKQL